MPANRYGGGGRYYHADADGRKNKNNSSAPVAHVKTELKIAKDAKPKIDQTPLKAPQKTEENSKFKPAFVATDKSPASGTKNIGGDKPLGEKNQKTAPHERKFTQRSRLFIGNLPLDMSEEEFKKLFASYGEISETFINAEKGFGFVRLDTRANAEKAKWELDGMNLRNNRQLRVRFATHGAALSVKNINSQVSNELLEEAFAQFGQVERAVVIVDDRGRSTERGIVEFARKSSAAKALQQIRDGCFLLTSSPRAISVSYLEQEDSEDGLPERNLQKNPVYYQERDAPPRFAQNGTFEEEFSRRWKALDDLEKHQREQLDKNIQGAKEKLEMEMENAIQEHRNMLMKQDLMRRQEELQRLEDARKREMERRQQLEMAREEARKTELEDLQRQQELLRAQIEGVPAYKSESFRGGMPRQGFAGRGGSPASQNILQEALAQEMMAGPGGLGPAPSRFDQNRTMMNNRGPANPPAQQQAMGNVNRGYGAQPYAGQRRGYAEGDFADPQKRRRY